MRVADRKVAAREFREFTAPLEMKDQGTGQSKEKKKEFKRRPMRWNSKNKIYLNNKWLWNSNFPDYLS